MNKEIRAQFNKEIVTLAVPFALQGLLTALVGASDALMLGRLTQDAIAAVSLAIPITLIGWKFFHWAPIDVYMVMCADEIVKFPVLIPRYRQYIWLKNLTRE